LERVRLRNILSLDSVNLPVLEGSPKKNKEKLEVLVAKHSGEGGVSKASTEPSRLPSGLTFSPGTRRSESVGKTTLVGSAPASSEGTKGGERENGTTAARGGVIIQETGKKHTTEKFLTGLRGESCGEFDLRSEKEKNELSFDDYYNLESPKHGRSISEPTTGRRKLEPTRGGKNGHKPSVSGRVERFT